MELHSLEDTKKLAKIISKKITKSDVIFLYGEIGVGKTTFIRFLINQLEAKKKIKKSNVLSPTFNLVYDYDIGKIKILHYDLYRIKNNKDVLLLASKQEASRNKHKIKFVIEFKRYYKNHRLSSFSNHHYYSCLHIDYLLKHLRKI